MGEPTENPGPNEPLHELLATHLPRLRAFVRLKMDPSLRGKESVSDVVQSACRELLDPDGGFEYRGEQELRSWLYSAALHKVQEKLRFHHAAKRDVGREVSPKSSAAEDMLLDCYATRLTPSRHAIGSEQLERFEQAFDQLSEKHRDVILCSRILGLSHAEIGAKLGMKTGAVRALLFRALTRLSVLVEKMETDGG